MPSLFAVAAAVLLGSCAPQPDTAQRDTATSTRTARVAPAPAEAPAKAAAAQRPALLRHPIIWNAEREVLTQAYLRHHHGGAFDGTAQQDSHMVPRMVVVHWTAGPSLKSARNTFLQTTQQRSRRRAHWNLLNLSSHFLVDRDGTIVQLMETDRVGRHTIGLNHLAIGIENVGDRDNWPLTRSQVEANASLVRWLAAKHPTLTHLIGHSEYRAFEGTELFRDRTPYRTARIDPGEDFMDALRLEVADLGLAGPPAD